VSTAHKSLDGHIRKRFYLFRHGEVDYTPQGKVVKNPDLVNLTEVGKKQAKSIDENTKEFSIERIICSGLPRTLQTAEHVASRRDITIECFPSLKEYEWNPDLLKDTKIERFGYLFEDSLAKEMIGGTEDADEFYRRITYQLETIIKEDWNEMAAFLHGAVNAAIMCWVNDVDISFASKYDQDHAALNIIDIDVNEKGKIVRKILKRYNIPPNLSTIDSDMRSSWENTASKIANLK
jgi:probable phosphoglycerate mutase